MTPTPVRIPLLDLKAQYRNIRAEIDIAIAGVLENTQFVLGTEVFEFEKEFAAYCGTTDCIALNSGTSALHLALLAAGVGPGDEVITVPFTFIASVAAIGYVGARAVLVDIDPVTFTLDVNAFEAAVTSRTKAVLPVHLYGQTADMGPITEVARRYGLVVIEDAAQAHGAEYKSRPAGSLGDIACFSFYPTKNLGAYGEAGAITTSNPTYAKKVRMLRDWGQDRKYHHVERAFNYRMEGMQGAILRVKLRHLEAWTEARRERARQYDTLLRGADIKTPAELPWARHVYHVYTVRSARRDQLQTNLASRGIQTGIHYPTPAHLQPAFADLGYGPGAFPNSETASKEVLSLPMFPEMSLAQVEEVCAAVKDAAVKQRVRSAHD